jgi:gamma-glutamylcyclotransferase (GGCT)/AIG2-like uncharacterized protein YtfP
LPTNRDAPKSLFFYGTLKAAEVREAVLGYKVPENRLAAAKLSGFEVRRVAGTFYPMIVAGPPEAMIVGVLLSGINRRELDRFDRLEGADYQRADVAVECDGRIHATQIYKPINRLPAAELWDFASWYKKDLENFLSQDFDLGGVRRP